MVTEDGDTTPGASKVDWGALLEISKKDQEKWERKGEKIVKRYRDERSDVENEMMEQKRFNILWSNIRTLFPTIYAKKPQAQVERRYKDADPVGRTASQILERALQYEIDHYSDYDSTLKAAVLDRLLPGRGVAWVRYDEGPGITDDTGPRKYECTPVDYVFWKDFRHSPARTWEEVTWVARLVYMGRAEGVERFGKDEFKDVPLTHEPVGLDDTVTQDPDSMKKAKVWEIWDKSTQTVIWKAEGKKDPLDERADPMGLQGFFPCPKPLFATTTTDTLIPVADYLEYQDQATELDELTQRIALLVKAVKVVGVYDSSQTGVQRMLAEGVGNTLIPVDQWAAFAEKGGLKGVVDWLPLDIIVQALGQLYISREQTKQVIYEITGISDIIRGASNSQETATAQRIKGNFAGLRLKETQGDVARFATDLLRLKAQIMCSLYRPETLVAMSGVEQTGDDPQLVAKALELLKSGDVRNYRIEIATDSMVEIDEQAEKESRLEFLNAAGAFLEKAVVAAQQAPEIKQLVAEMLMFGVRSFKAGRSLEGAFERAIAQMEQPQQPKPDPEMAKVQAQQQQDAAKLQAEQQAEQMRLQMEAQAEQQRLQQEAQFEQFRAAIEEQRNARELQMQAQLEEMRTATQEREAMRDMEFQKWKAELEAATKIQVADIGAEASKENAATAAAEAEIAREVK